MALSEGIIRGAMGRAEDKGYEAVLGDSEGGLCYAQAKVMSGRRRILNIVESR